MCDTKKFNTTVLFHYLSTLSEIIGKFQKLAKYWR
jgi:hypothetical protein